MEKVISLDEYKVLQEGRITYLSKSDSAILKKIYTLILKMQKMDDEEAWFDVLKTTDSDKFADFMEQFYYEDKLKFPDFEKQVDEWFGRNTGYATMDNLTILLNSF